MKPCQPGPLATLAVAVLMSCVALSGCASQHMITAETDDVTAQYVPGPPPTAPAPAATAPPVLPVLKMNARGPTPFKNGQEPTIRIGKHGKVAPPASRRPADGQLEYARMDSYGNLIDHQGQVLYQAGTPQPQPSQAAQYREPFDSSHASPAEIVARSSRAPLVQPAGQRMESPVGVVSLRNGEQLMGAQGARTAMQAPQIKQFPIADRGLPEDRAYGIRVDTHAAQQHHAPEPYVAPAGLEPVYGQGAQPVTNTYPSEVAHQPYYAPAAPATPDPLPQPEALPTNAELTKAYGSANRAPGPQGMTKQRRYKGKREKAVQALYKRAMKRVKGKKYKSARSVFEKILKKHHDHDLADNALYWMAEGAYAQGDWLQAMTWFQDVILRYPDGNKLPDAMLKSALCYAKLGDIEYAKQMLGEVETLFVGLPVSEVARSRRTALERERY